MQKFVAKESCTERRNLYAAFFTRDDGIESSELLAQGIADDEKFVIADFDILALAFSDKFKKLAYAYAC